MFAPVTQDVVSKIEQYVVTICRSLSLLGFAVAIVEDNGVIYQRGFGRSVTSQTPFILGSLSKSFTALAVMQLVESSKLELDMSVQQYLPWFAIAGSFSSSAITLRHLLTHSSGLSRSVGRDLLSGRGGKSIEQSVRDLASVRLVHAPGSRFEYSNSNYLVLALLIEVVSGESYSHYIQHSIFEPLSMQHSHVTLEAALADGLAQGHRWWFGFPLPYNAPYLYDAQGAAFLISSAEDMARWLLLHLSDGSVDGTRLLSSAGIEELHRPQVPTGKGAAMAAMGWRVEQLGDEEILRHGGEVSNYRADMVLVPDHKLGVVVLQNCNNGLVAQLGLDQIALNVVRLLLGQSVPKKRLRFPAFYLLVDLTLFALTALQVVSLVQLVRSFKWRPGSMSLESVLALVADVAVSLAVLWQVPRRADMSWRGLWLYVPDLSRWLMSMVSLSLVRSAIRLYRWFA